jgi:hypothetical protein
MSRLLSGSHPTRGAVANVTCPKCGKKGSFTFPGFGFRSLDLKLECKKCQSAASVGISCPKCQYRWSRKRPGENEAVENRCPKCGLRFKSILSQAWRKS